MKINFKTLALMILTLVIIFVVIIATFKVKQEYYSKGKLNYFSAFSGYKVFIDDQEVNEKEIELKTGKHQFKAIKEDYKEFTKEILIEEEKTTTVVIDFEILNDDADLDELKISDYVEDNPVD